MNLQILRKIYSSLTYEQFCERCGFVESQYAIDKFVVLKRGLESLCSFDSETLANLFEGEV
jgi:hypothetical protein